MNQRDKEAIGEGFEEDDLLGLVQQYIYSSKSDFDWLYLEERECKIKLKK